jgi:hypothetical protein
MLRKQNWCVVGDVLNPAKVACRVVAHLQVNRASFELQYPPAAGQQRSQKEKVMSLPLPAIVAAQPGYGLGTVLYCRTMARPCTVSTPRSWSRRTLFSAASAACESAHSIRIPTVSGSIALRLVPVA